MSLPFSSHFSAKMPSPWVFGFTRIKALPIDCVPGIFLEAQLSPPTELNSVNRGPLLTTTSSLPDDGSSVSDASPGVRLSLGFVVERSAAVVRRDREVEDTIDDAERLDAIGLSSDPDRAGPGAVGEMAGSHVDADVLQPVVAATAIRRGKPVVRQVNGVLVE